jgi:peptidoglycan/xylan/chitin deacetylase (PgdA/CDA1 family)
MQRHTVTWPNGELMACTFRVAYEAFHGSAKFKKDPKIKVNQASLSHAEYGGRVGIWRLMEIFDRNDISASINLNGLAVEMWPDSVKALHEAGHELAAHQTTNSIHLPDLNEEQERAEIRACTKMIEDAVGVRPIGWGSAGNMHTAHTLRILAEEGYKYFGDPFDDDVPYVVGVAGRRMVIIPKLNYANDWRAWSGGLGNGDNFVAGFVEAFDFLYAEARSGRPGYIDVITHAELGGRPNLAGAVERMIRYVRQFGSQVWIANRREITDYLLSGNAEVEEYRPYA